MAKKSPPTLPNDRHRSPKAMPQPPSKVAATMTWSTLLLVILALVSTTTNNPSHNNHFLSLNIFAIAASNSATEILDELDRPGGDRKVDINKIYSSDDD